MNNKREFALLFLVGFVLAMVLAAVEGRAQDNGTADKSASEKAKDEKGAVVAVSTKATTQQKDPVQSNDVGPYTIVSSIELGARAVVIDGNQISGGNKYRSDLNYDAGFRIFDSSFLMKATDGNGPLFDALMASAFGWGVSEHNGDPSRYLRVNVEKNKWYRFDSNYRQFDYFNSLSNFALNQHNSDTQVKVGDLDLTLLPQNERLKLNLGYSLARNSGPVATTYDYSRDEFPVFAPTRVESNEYRIGADGKLWVFDISFLQGFRYFKEDTTYFITGFAVGNQTANQTVLNSFSRDLPTRGSTPFTRFSLHTLVKKRLDFTGRYIYTNTNTDYTMFEGLTGKDFSGNNVKSDNFTVIGNAKRPNGMGDIGVTVFATDKLRLSNVFRVNNFRINGGQELLEALFRTRTTAFGETVLPPVFVDSFSFRTTKYRRYQNTFEVDYDFHPRFSAYFGYRYTNRRIVLFANDFSVGQPVIGEPEAEEIDNRTDSYIFGFKAKPVRIWSLYFDLEHGSNDNVFTRVSSYDFTSFRVRSILRPSKTLSINASLVTKDNTNPSITADLREFGADINTRIFSSSVDWTLNEKCSLSGGYTYTHLTSEADIIFFLNSVRTSGQSRYFVRDNFAFLTGYVQLHPRVRFYGGYRIHHDSGQGDRASLPNIFVGSYPQQFQSPEAKIQVRLHDRFDWIAGYQGFLFQEKFVNRQHYQAHLPYSSLKIYFGRRTEE